MREKTARTVIGQLALRGELERLSGMAMAAGTDFNDELTFILNHADVSLRTVGLGHPARQNLIELQHSVRRCAEITRCLLLLTERARDAVRYATLIQDHADSGDRDFL